MPQRLSPIRKTFGVIGVLLRTFKHLDFARFISGRRTITYAGVPTGIRTPDTKEANLLTSNGLSC